MMNTSYSLEAFDEFLHGYKGAWADEVRKNQLKWPELPKQEKNMIWPSQVILDPSLATAEDVFIDVKSKQETISNPTFKDSITNNFKSSNEIDLTNNFDLLNNCKRKSIGLKNFDQIQIDTKEDTSLSNSSSNIRTPNENSYNINEKFINTTHDALKAISLSCAEDGERIALIHCYRPFFKKIDGLCDRIKQDLIHHDSVTQHVKTKGIMWVIKDLIFVCTRIINAWNITKGYVYDPSEGLNTVRTTLTPEFVSSFVEWQETTFTFLESLMKSFLSLDILVHTSNNSQNVLEFLKELDVFMQNLMKQTKTCKSKSDNNKYWEQCGCDSCKLIVSSKSTYNALLKLCVICSDYGEKVAQNYISFPYFKKVDSLCNRTKFELNNSDGALSNLNSQGTVWAVKELIFASTRIINAWNITKSYVYGSSEALDKIRMGMSSDFGVSFTAWQETTRKFIENLRMSFLRLDTLAHSERSNLKKEQDKVISTPIKILKNHLQMLKSGEVFFRAIFCRNYFPDFIEKTPDFMDIRSIIQKCVNGSYKHINEVVHDVRFIIYQINKYLMRNIEPNLNMAVMNFQADVEMILAEKSFATYNFNHIQGRPDEILFLYN